MIENSGIQNFQEKKKKRMSYFILIVGVVMVIGYFFVPDKNSEGTKGDANDKEKLVYDEVKKTVTTGKSNVLNEDELEEFNTIRKEVTFIVLKYLNEKEQNRFWELSEINNQRIFNNEETKEFLNFISKAYENANQEEQNKIKRFFEIAQNFKRITNKSKE